MALRRVVRGKGPRRKTQWVGPADQANVTVAAGGASILNSFDPQAQGLQSPTIVRTRGSFSFQPAAFSADVAIHGAYGIGVVSDQSFNAGVASMPEPFSDADWDGWFVWRSFTMAFEFQDATGTQFPVNIMYEIDSKAMRKVGPNETVVAIAESQSGAFNCADHTRLLFKLS